MAAQTAQISGSPAAAFAALTPAQRADHRAKIGLRVQAILGQFWRDDATPDAVVALEVEGWCDVLAACTHSEIREAWAEYQRTGPRTTAGRLYKPDAGALYRIIHARRPRPALSVVPRTAEPARVACTAEAAQRIMAEVFGEAHSDPDRIAAELAAAKRVLFGGEA